MIQVEAVNHQHIRSTNYYFDESVSTISTGEGEDNGVSLFNDAL